MHPAAGTGLNSAEDLIRFLEMLNNPPKEIEAGTILPKSRLFSNPSNGEVGWLKEGNKDIAITTKFDYILQALVGKIRDTKLPEQILTESKETLLRLLPEVKKSLRGRIAIYDLRNNRWLNCHYWRVLRPQVMALQDQLDMQVDGLAGKVTSLPTQKKPPPPPMAPPVGKGLKKPSPPAPSESEGQGEPPATPTHRRTKSGAAGTEAPPTPTRARANSNVEPAAAAAAGIVVRPEDLKGKLKKAADRPQKTTGK